MPLRIEPYQELVLREGEEELYTLDMVEHLGGDTVDAHVMTITDKDNGSDVTGTFSGMVSESEGVLSFGIKAASSGNYTIKLWVTCNELLPDAVTPREFLVVIDLVVL